MTFADYAVPFVLLLGGLIFFHELGHFAVAKWLGVKVERFSIGFGPTIIHKRFGETEYRLAWLPLGGYVRMLGELPGDELPEEDRARAFTSQAVWKRVAIASAGPAMNFILPVVLLAGMYMSGMPTATTRIGTVVEGSEAAAAGLEAGDRIVAVDEQPVDRWDGLETALAARAGERVALRYERGDATFDAEIPRLPPGGLGIEHDSASPTLAVVSGSSAAGMAGLETGDRVRSLGGVEVTDWRAWQAALEATRGPLDLEVLRRVDEEIETLRVEVPATSSDPWTLSGLGVLSGETAIVFVEEDSPAGRAGLEAGDLLVDVDGDPVTSFRAFAQDVRTSEGRGLALGVLRDGERRDLLVAPERRRLERHGVTEQAWAIGIRGGAARVPGEVREEVTRNPFTALGLGATRTWDITVRTFEGIGLLITGQVSRENLAGPIGIGVIAAQFFQLGWLQYLHIMAVISVNLAILNLLPVPILDGGQIVFALAEGVKGEPLSLRVREVAAQIGLSILVLLMGFAFWNDISRHWGRIVDFFEGLV